MVPGQHTGRSTRLRGRPIATRLALCRAAAALLVVAAPACTQGHASVPPKTTSWVTAAAQAMSKARWVPARDETCRQVLRVSSPGTRIRLRLSNASSNTSLKLAAVTAGIRRDGAAIVAPTPVQLHGRRSITIAPHRQVTTDAVPLVVREGDDVATSFAV